MYVSVLVPYQALLMTPALSHNLKLYIVMPPDLFSLLIMPLAIQVAVELGRG